MTRSPNMVEALDSRKADLKYRGDAVWAELQDHIRAMPSARAASLRPLPASRFSRSGITIARFAIALCLLIALYFAAQFLRGAF